ncbi:hypothetical protein [Streptomyces sp. NPDC057302]|uniref:hypothetical protein n=1 Tax=Streptomyces sp. NPDC057302 TaxID=3346094 RepID=UPI00363438B7
MADPVSIGREFTTDDEGDLHVRATVREWPYPTKFSANGLRWDDDGLYVYQAPLLHPLRQRWDAPVAVKIADGQKHQAQALSFAWTNPGTRTAVVSLSWSLAIHATPAPDVVAAGHWDVTFSDSSGPLMAGATHTLAALEGPVDAVWQSIALEPMACGPGESVSASAALEVANHTGVPLEMTGWTVRAAGFAIEGGH